MPPVDRRTDGPTDRLIRSWIPVVVPQDPPRVLKKTGTRAFARSATRPRTPRRAPRCDWLHGGPVGTSPGAAAPRICGMAQPTGLFEFTLHDLVQDRHAKEIIVVLALHALEELRQLASRRRPIHVPGRTAGLGAWPAVAIK